MILSVVQMVMTRSQIFLLGFEDDVKNALLKFSISTYTVLFLAFFNVINI